MKSLKSVNSAGALLLLLILTLTIVAAQEKPTAAQEKQAAVLNAIEFDRVVLFTLLAIENNYRVKEQLLPNVHFDDYYMVILNTTKRLAMANTPKKQISPVIKVPKKQEEK